MNCKKDELRVLHSLLNYAIKRLAESKIKIVSCLPLAALTRHYNNMSATRFEKKFVVTARQAALLEKFFSQNIVTSYKVSSIYYDTSDLDSYLEVIEGANFKTKYRVRFYNDSLSEVFWERKEKENKLSTKKRWLIPEYKSNFSSWDVPLALRASKKLNPKIEISYVRKVLSDRNGERLTLDKDIIYKKMNASAADKALEGCYILEVKFSRKLSARTTMILNTTQAREKNFSKYATCMNKIL